MITADSITYAGPAIGSQPQVLFTYFGMLCGLGALILYFVNKKFPSNLLYFTIRILFMFFVFYTFRIVFQPCSSCSGIEFNLELFPGNIVPFYWNV